MSLKPLMVLSLRCVYAALFYYILNAYDCILTQAFKITKTTVQKTFFLSYFLKQLNESK
jgi:uncharacterized MnhB-related membrane protein